MTLEDYRFLFIAATLVLALVAAAPALSVVLPVGGSERFSELWLLGPGHMAEGYPSNVEANVTYRLFVGVENHLGSLAYYRIDVKFRNQTQPLPDLAMSAPSPLRPLYEFQCLVRDGETWESPLSFSFANITFQDDVASVGAVEINEVTFPVDSLLGWDSERSVFFGELFFELYLYDRGLRDFRFHDRFVKLQLNATGA